MSRPPSLLASRYRRVGQQQSTDEDDGTQVERKSIRRPPKKPPGGRSVNRHAKKDGKLNQALEKFVRDHVAMGVPKLCEDFNAIKTDTQPLGRFTIKAFEANVPTKKNRYRDVFCIDETRVILNWPEGQPDYIHANWVNIPEPQRFICTQAPTEESIEDFWRMVWQVECRSVLMLCNLVEQGKPKCTQYWPKEKGATMVYPTLTVTKKGDSINPEEALTRTKLEICVGNKTHMVEHIYWKDWPDRGVPTNFCGCLRLLDLIKNFTPIVVHCSAGIGRTGTIVGLDVLQARLKKGEVPTLNGVVRELREYRHGSVQTDIQYVYMIRVMIEYAVNRKLMKLDECVEWLAEYAKLCAARGC